MEVVNPRIPRGHIRCALFDFDGTLSLLREGWQQVMLSLMIDALMQTPAHESESELRGLVTDLIDQTAGQQTIYQMIRLAEEVKKRGGVPGNPQKYKQASSEQLLARVRERVAAIQSGTVTPDAWMVPGALPMLQSLRARGVTCYIVSGTDEGLVRDEAAVLGIASYFAGIYGAHDDYKNHSKKIIIRRIAEKHHLRAGEWVTFGDGVPEIADTKAIGGIAVGVAMDEATRRGVNPRKRAALLHAGAEMILPDFREHAALVAFLFAEERNAVPDV